MWLASHAALASAMRTGSVALALASSMLAASVGPRSEVNNTEPDGPYPIDPRIDPVRIAVLSHEPRLILRRVARRMGITLRPDVAVPTVHLESRTSLTRVRVAAERQWGFRPHTFITFFAAAANEIYLIDDAVAHARRGGTVDDVLAHEFVHYLQATYRKESLAEDLSEFEAVAVQLWYRRESMERELLATDTRKL